MIPPKKRNVFPRYVDLILQSKSRLRNIAKLMLVNLGKLRPIQSIEKQKLYRKKTMQKQQQALLLKLQETKGLLLEFGRHTLNL